MRFLQNKYKKLKKLIITALLFCATISYSQNEFQIESNLGFLYQKDISINNEILKSTGNFGARIGANYLKKFDSNMYFETGLFLKYTTGTYKIETVDFNFNSIRLQVPFYVGYQINDLWRFNLGASVENNKDFEDLAFYLNENLRYDFLVKVAYNYSDLLDFSLYANTMVSKTKDINTLTSPRNGVYIGVIFKIPNSKTNKED